MLLRFRSNICSAILSESAKVAQSKLKTTIMETKGKYPKKNLFIVENDPENAIELKNLLEKQFPNAFYFCVFHTGMNALEECNPGTDIIIINHYLTGENGSIVAKSFIKTNPKIKVIMLTSSQEILIEVEEYWNTLGYFVEPPVQQKNSFSALKYSRIMYPFQYIVKEIRARQFVQIFILVFILVGLTSFILINID